VHRIVLISAATVAFVMSIAVPTAEALIGHPSAAPSLTVAGRELHAQGYLVPDPAALARAKVDALAAATDRVDGVRRDPVSGAGWEGVSDPNVAPSDSTGAVGPTRYVEMVNDVFGLYDRTVAPPKLLASATLAAFTHSATPSLTDPQVLWDPSTKRFYTSVLNADVVDGGSTDGVDYEFAFSRTSSPTSTADTQWCHYHLNFGYDATGLLPDYPKMGDTKDFVLFGANVFDLSGAETGADIQWIHKPPSGTTCPAQSSLAQGVKRGLRNADGTAAGTLVPAQQTDPSSTGWIASAEDPTNAPAHVLTVFKVSKSSTTGAAVIAAGKAVTVLSYSVPPPAAQPGTTRRFDTLDARLTQAVSAIDPSNNNSVGIWTQHTVAGGAGTQVEWYEVGPYSLKTLRSGAASDPALWTFNGAVSPDRAVSGSTKRFGGSMVMGFDTSSSSSLEAIRMLSVTPTTGESAFVMAKASGGIDSDFSCQGSPSVCRWGDYAAATPDPIPALDTSATEGTVWLTNAWDAAGSSSSDADWRTWNWPASP